MSGMLLWVLVTLQAARAATFTFFDALPWIISSGCGALVTLVAFRTRLALIDRRIEARRTEIRKVKTDLTGELGAIRRRQTVTLEIVADIARKVGVDSRFSDAVVRFLTTEDAHSDRAVRDRELNDTDEQETPQ